MAESGFNGSQNPYNERHRKPPSSKIKGHFGPYKVRELEYARECLIRDMYNDTNGKILNKIKIKCGILPTRGGYFGCAPHPITRVSFESQSCELVASDQSPWLKPEESTIGATDSTVKKYEVSSSNYKIRRDGEGTSTFSARDVNEAGSNTGEPSSTYSLAADGAESNGEGVDVGDFNASYHTSFDQGQGAESGNEKQETQNRGIICLKCDLCNFTSVDRKKMTNHLKIAEHFSASKCEGFMEDDRLVARFHLRGLDLTEASASYKSFIPTCLICGDTFEDIHSCIRHSQRQHEKQLYQKYGLCKVKRSSKLVVSDKTTCSVCSCTFKTLVQLDTHQKQMRHMFFMQPGLNENIMAICNHCELVKTTFLNMCAARHHVLFTHGEKDLMVLYLNKCPIVREMLPVKVDCLEDDNSLGYVTSKLIQQPGPREKRRNNRKLKDKMHKLVDSYRNTTGKRHIDLEQLVSGDI